MKWFSFSSRMIVLTLIGIGVCVTSVAQKNSKCQLLELALKNDTVKEYFLLKANHSDTIVLIDRDNYLKYCKLEFDNGRPISVITQTPLTISNKNSYILIQLLERKKRSGSIFLFQKETGVLIKIFYLRKGQYFFVNEVKLSFF